MNTLNGSIEAIETDGSLSLVRIKVQEAHLSSIIIDTQETATYLKVGHSVKVIFKETEVIIGKGKEHAISLQNKLAGTVENIETGNLLSKLWLDTSAGKIVSVITTNAVRQLLLNKGSEITAMIKTNEIMLSE